MLPIAEIARVMGMDDKLVIPYGHFKAKVSLDALHSNGHRGKPVVVTAMTPTPAGAPSASRSRDSTVEETCSCSCTFCPCDSQSHESLSGY